MKHSKKRLGVLGCTLLMASSAVVLPAKAASAEPVTLVILGLGKLIFGKTAVVTTGKVVGGKAAVVTTGKAVGGKAAIGGNAVNAPNLLPAAGLAPAAGLGYYQQKAAEGFVFGASSRAGKEAYENFFDSEER